MTIHEHAGKPARPEDTINIARLVSDYYVQIPNVNINEQRGCFGTSGHRGSATKVSFNEHHILAICQAVAEYRQEQGYQGPLFLGKDTHALSEPAFVSAISVLIANNVQVIVQADGLIITPSHNPPTDGGIKYNPSHGA